MDNRRTPNQQKGFGHPKSIGSKSKFARPSSHRKQDGNSTILLGANSHNATVMGSARDMNQTVRRNLDITISGPSNPRIKSSISTLVTDVDLEYDLAYNEYLQALMKQQIVRKTINQHSEKLNDQVFIQSEQLHKLENTYRDISNGIDSLKHQSEIVEILDMLKDGMDKIENVCEKYCTYNNLDQLSNILKQESNLVSVHNIKPISSQEEYDELISILNGLVAILHKILNSGRNFEEVNKLSTAIKTFNELKNTVEQTSNKVCDIRKRAAARFIKHGSDMFAEQGGYF